jgi:hypothetical protein
VPILTLLIAILCLIAVFRQLKVRNFFGAGYAAISTLVFGWFAVMSIVDHIFN